MGWITLEEALETSLASLPFHTKGVHATQKLFVKMEEIFSVKGNSAVYRPNTTSYF